MQLATDNLAWFNPNYQLRTQSKIPLAQMSPSAYETTPKIDLSASVKADSPRLLLPYTAAP